MKNIFLTQKSSRQVSHNVTWKTTNVHNYWSFCMEYNACRRIVCCSLEKSECECCSIAFTREKTKYVEFVSTIHTVLNIASTPSRNQIVFFFTFQLHWRPIKYEQNWNLSDPGRNLRTGGKSLSLLSGPLHRHQLVSFAVPTLFTWVWSLRAQSRASGYLWLRMEESFVFRTIRSLWFCFESTRNSASYGYKHIVCIS